MPEKSSGYLLGNVEILINYFLLLLFFFPNVLIFESTAMESESAFYLQLPILCLINKVDFHCRGQR